MVNQVKRAIDSNLSRMCVMDHDIKAIMENAQEGKKVKKKLPAALVMIAVLILAAAMALAANGFLHYAFTLRQKGQSQDLAVALCHQNPQGYAARLLVPLCGQACNAGERSRPDL